MDPYQVLGVGYTATDAEIKKAYYTLARKYHPDNFAFDPAQAELANRKMREINAAYEQIRQDRAAGIRGEDARRRAGRTAGQTGRSEDAPGQAYTGRDSAGQTSTGRASSGGADRASGGTGREERSGREEHTGREERSGRSGASGDSRTGAGASFTGQDPRYRADGMPRDFVGYERLRRAVNEENYDFAEAQLLGVPELLRNAEWHYLRSLTLLRRLYYHDAFREIGTACRMDRKNEEYRKTREEMRRRVSRSFARGGENADTEEAKKKRKACNNPCADCCFRALGLEDRKL